MSNRANANKYSQMVGGGRSGGGVSPYPWIRRREAEEELQRQIQLLKLAHELGLVDLKAEGEEGRKTTSHIEEERRKTDREKSRLNVDEDLAKFYKMTPEDAKALSPKARQILSNQMDAELSAQTGKDNPELSTMFKEASKAGTGFRAAGLNPNNMIGNIPANSMGTVPNVPGLTGPLNSGMGLQTIFGPRESRVATEVGGVTLPNGMQIPGRPVLETTVSGGGERGIPYSPEIEARAKELSEGNDTTLQTAPQPDINAGMRNFQRSIGSTPEQMLMRLMQMKMVNPAMMGY